MKKKNSLEQFSIERRARIRGQENLLGFQRGWFSSFSAIWISKKPEAAVSAPQLVLSPLKEKSFAHNALVCLPSAMSFPEEALEMVTLVNPRVFPVFNTTPSMFKSSPASAARRKFTFKSTLTPSNNETKLSCYTHTHTRHKNKHKTLKINK